MLDLLVNNRMRAPRARAWGFRLSTAEAFKRALIILSYTIVLVSAGIASHFCWIGWIGPAALASLASILCYSAAHHRVVLAGFVQLGSGLMATIASPTSPARQVRS